MRDPDPSLMKSETVVRILHCARRWLPAAAFLAIVAVVLLTASLSTAPANAQDAEPADSWQTGIEAPTTTIIKQTPDGLENSSREPPPGMTSVKLVALLTADGQRIDNGLVWRVFEFDKKTGESSLVQTLREASPSLTLRNATYIVNVAFGRANLTRELTLEGGGKSVEKFVLNAGGLRIKIQHNERTIDNSITKYAIYSDRTQLDERELILANVRPGLIVRLNAGIYHIVSRFGDANATVSSDITVEAGKLTEATINHSAARVRFKLVTREGGEALPDTQWRVETPQGEVVKKSVGALPMHILAPGTYTVVGISEGQSYAREFTVGDGEMIDVEVVRR